MRSSAIALVSASLVTAVLPPPAAATGASWPIQPEVTWPVRLTDGAGRATVAVRVGDDATEVDVEVRGSDGMRVEPDNKLSLRVASLRRGQRFVFEVEIRPGAGRSYLSVSTRARFAHGTAGGTVHDFPYGAESPEQLREHSRCVRQDPEGTWIRIMGCDEATPQSASPSPPAPSGPGTVLAPPLPAPVALVDVATLRRGAGPVGRRVTVEGYVADWYRCPPCPPGAMCKPCMMHSALFVTAAAAHGPINMQSPAPDVAVLGVEDPASFARGARYRFEVTLSDRRDTEMDAIVAGAVPARQSP